MLVLSFCKPVIHKLKILGGGKLEYYKSMGGGGGGGGGGKIFDSNSLGENTLEETAFWTFLSDKKCIQCNL